jgi:tight adherence protein C
MNVLMIVAISFGLVAGLTFAVGALLLRLLPSIRAERLAAPLPVTGTGEVSILRWDEQAARGWQAVLEELGRWLTPRDAGLFARYRKRLILGGFHNPGAVALFLGAKGIVGIALGFSYLVYGGMVQRALPNLLTVSIILGGLGFFLPDVWLRLRTKQRQQAVNNALPDVLDLLMVCVEAGMGFDAAVARVAEQPGSKAGPLHEELFRMHLEVRAGRPREEALRALADRLGTEEIRSVVGSFIQTDRLGTPLGRTLRVQAEASRVQRRHRAETKAQLAPLLMLVPTVIFLMPSFMLVAMGPSLLLILKILGNIGK